MRQPPSGKDKPAIVVGWHLEAGMELVQVRERLERDADLLPEWFVTDWEHGYGGHVPDEYDAVTTHLIGAVLPLEKNTRHAIGDLAGFIARLRDNDDRERHFHTRDADSLAKPRQLVLAQALAACLRLPALSDATEALATFEPAEPLHHFEGWALHTGSVFDQAAAADLASAGKRGKLGAPYASLVWRNCDL